MAHAIDCNDECDIVVNRAQCLNCLAVLESKDTHDYNSCTCSNRTSVDGGHEYLRRAGVSLEKIQELSVYSCNLESVAIPDDEGNLSSEGSDTVWPPPGSLLARIVANLPTDHQLQTAGYADSSDFYDTYQPRGTDDKSQFPDQPNPTTDDLTTPEGYLASFAISQEELTNAGFNSIEDYYKSQFPDSFEPRKDSHATFKPEEI